MLVMKFGGASVATPQSFLGIADLILSRAKEEKKIVVVVSAMAGVTDQLFDLAKQVHPNPPGRELSMMASVGDRVSGALLAMALDARGKPAKSFTGSQAGIITSDHATEAEVVEVKGHRIESVLEQGHVAVVAGFQGVSRKGDVTTLGRGGSDTTAVALGVALGAEVVEFYKDVPGIFDADPKVHLGARLYQELGYQEAMQIGGKVLHQRSIRLAEKNGVQMWVRSFQCMDLPGTVVGKRARKEAVTYEVVG